MRQAYQASILTDAGVEPVMFGDLDDFEVIKGAARDHDSRFFLSALFFIVDGGDRGEGRGGERSACERWCV